MTSTRPEIAPEERAAALKERIYVTFTALAVVLALRSHGGEVGASETITTLLITVVGTLLAVTVADFVSHLVAHAQLPTRSELARMLRTTLGAFGAVVLPLVFVGFAVAGSWSVDAALRASTIALVVTLGVVGYIAVRRVRIPFWQKVLLLLGEVAVGGLVIALELLAHG
jgi:hypothetical protein